MKDLDLGSGVNDNYLGGRRLEEKPHVFKVFEYPLQFCFSQRTRQEVLGFALFCF